MLQHAQQPIYIIGYSHLYTNSSFLESYHTHNTTLRRSLIDIR